MLRSTPESIEGTGRRLKSKEGNTKFCTYRAAINVQVIRYKYSVRVLRYSVWDPFFYPDVRSDEGKRDPGQGRAIRLEYIPLLLASTVVQVHVRSTYEYLYSVV